MPGAGGASRSASVKPVPTLNRMPFASSTISAPSRLLCLPAPVAWPTTVASASWNVLTLSSVRDRPASYADAGCRSISPSPPSASTRASSSRRWSALVQTTCSSVRACGVCDRVSTFFA